MIIGDAFDPHVAAVALTMRSRPIVLDAASFLAGEITITADRLRVRGETVDPSRGWLRRLTPEGWADHIRMPGVEGVSRSAAVSALAIIARDERVKWLTQLDHLGGAENKPFQYRRAAACGVPVPRWLVTTDARAVPSVGDWVVKPLGPGSFVDRQGRGRVVPTRPLGGIDAGVASKVPFIIQERIHAKRHARVVTVRGEVWSATLSAQGLPLDWRTAAEAHDGFMDAPVPSCVAEWAQAAARANRVRFSTQDWLEDDSGSWWFIDLNPAGQWLFLPSAVSERVTAAIARYLDGGS